VEIRRIQAAEWRAYREVRLRALRLAPYAYSSRFEDAVIRTDETWQEFVTRMADAENSAAFVLDRGGGEFAGLVSSTVDRESGRGEVFQMWLDEDLRGGGYASELLGAVEGFCRERGASRVVLGVEDENPRARRFYEREGYVPTGATEPNGRGGVTVEMGKELGAK